MVADGPCRWLLLAKVFASTLRMMPRPTGSREQLFTGFSSHPLTFLPADYDFDSRFDLDGDRRFSLTFIARPGRVVRERERAQATPAQRGRDMRRAARLATFAICTSHQQAVRVGPNDAGAFRQPNAVGRRSRYRPLLIQR
jgi:hypothetical protein